MTEWIWMFMMFIFVTGLVFVVATGFTMRRSSSDARLEDETDIGTMPVADADSSRLSAVGRDSKPDLVFGEITSPMAEFATEDDRTQVAPELRAAGYYGKHAITQYLAIRTACILVPLFLACSVAILLEKEWIVTVVIVGLIASALGFALPRIILQALGRRRTHQIEGGLPLAVDLITLGVSAGQNIMVALERTARELRVSHPVLAFELEVVYRQAQMDTLPHALEQFADRVQVPEVRNLVLILNQSARQGTDMSTALLEFANNYRMTIRQRADTRANRASFWMLFPTIFCLFTAAAIVLMGPVFIEMADRSSKFTADQREALTNPLFNPNPPPPADPNGN